MKNNLLRFISAYPGRSADVTNTFIIIITWVFMAILVNPIGDFPLNDDWAYGWTVKTLLEKGDFQLSDWTATNLLSQVVWGALFCLPFGFSFTALRLSTLTLGLIGVVATYGLLREVKTSPTISLIGAFIVALNPIYFDLSNSFNSDVPSFTFVTLSLYFLIRGLRLDSTLAIILGLTVSFISILNRQSGLVILPAFGFAYLIKKGLRVRTIIAAFSPTLLGIILHLSYSQWLQLTGRKPSLYNFQIERLLETFSKGFLVIFSTYAKNILIISVYLGLFLFPFLIVHFSTRFKDLSARQKQMSLFFTLFAVAIGVVFVAKGKQMPLVGNILDSSGLGPQELDGYNSFSDIWSKALTRIIGKVMTVIGVVGAVLLFQYLLLSILQICSQNQSKNFFQNWSIELAIFAGATFLYFLPIAGLDKKYWFDRYLILLFPLLMILISILKDYNQKRFGFRIVSLCLLMLLLYGGFTISATHDYLSWNRVRWQALDNLMQSKILPSHINGGFAFNGWHFGNRLETCNPKYQRSSEQKPVSWVEFTCIWGDESYEYTVSFVPKTDYNVEKQYTFRRWLPWREENLYVLHKNHKF